MANYLQLATCALLSVVLCFEIVNGVPLNPEDVAHLLPATPKTKNETVAAIVQDTVVQEAVQSAVGVNGTLSGLVVKKNTVILPADQPDVVLSHKEQILRAPTSQLENIQKNITDTVAATAEKENAGLTTDQEITLAQSVPELGSKILPGLVDPVVSEVLLAQKLADGDSPESLIVESLIVEKEESTTKSAESSEGVPVVTVGQKFVVPGIVQNAIQLPEGVYPQNISLPSVIDAKIARPIVAVLHHENVISLSPSTTTTTTTTTTTEKIDFSEDSSKESLVFGDRIPVAVVTDEQNIKPAVELEARKNKEVTVAFTIPEDNDNLNNESDENDMVAAEDIIFRPLFRYRQQENERTRILENRAYQRNSYNRYVYRSRQNPYRRPQRTRYYNDYDS